MAKENLAQVNPVHGAPTEPPGIPPERLTSGACEAARKTKLPWKLMAVLVGAFVVGALFGCGDDEGSPGSDIIEAPALGAGGARADDDASLGAFVLLGSCRSFGSATITKNSSNSSWRVNQCCVRTDNNPDSFHNLSENATQWKCP